MVSTLKLVFPALLFAFDNAVCIQQKLKLSESYLPVAMQLIAHYTDQLDHLKPGTVPQVTTTRRTTSPGGGIITWTESSAAIDYDSSTQFHRPGVFAPLAPQEYYVRRDDGDQSDFVLLPFHDQAHEYKVLKPENPKFDQFLTPDTEETLPTVLLPPVQHELFEPTLSKQNEEANIRNGDVFGLDLAEDELTDNSLQYLSKDVRDIVKLAHDKNDKRGFINSLDDRLSIGIPGKAKPPKMSQSNLRLTLLYDILSRDAKKQNLSQFNGYSDSVLYELVKASSDPRKQLIFALKSMVERKDCKDTYANNRAKEMIKELGTDESVLSKEIGNLHPLVFSLL